MHSRLTTLAIDVSPQLQCLEACSGTDPDFGFDPVVSLDWQDLVKRWMTKASAAVSDLMIGDVAGGLKGWVEHGMGDIRDNGDRALWVELVGRIQAYTQVVAAPHIDHEGNKDMAGRRPYLGSVRACRRNKAQSALLDSLEVGRDNNGLDIEAEADMVSKMAWEHGLVSKKDRERLGVFDFPMESGLARASGQVCGGRRPSMGEGSRSEV